MAAAEEKERLRKKLLAQRASMPLAEKQVINARVFETVMCEKLIQRCNVVFLYTSVLDEIDTRKMIEYALFIGKTVCVPKCVAKGVMIARSIRSLDELTEERFGIPEPSSACPLVPPEQIDLVFAPCLCVDRGGYRLGYGGGYYDRFLAHTTHALVCAICASDRIVPTTYPEPHDIPVHKILTEREVLCVHEK